MMTRGFSLLETLMYVGLFALLMQGAFAGIFAISESAERNQSKAYLEEEGEFIIDKISYEISNASSVALSNLNATSTEINLVSKENATSSIALLNHGFSIARGTAEFVPFSSNQVEVSNVSFTEPSSGSSSGLIHLSFTLQTRSSSGQELSEQFSTVSYRDL